MGARVAMMRLAKMNQGSVFSSGTGLHHRTTPASGGCQQPERDMRAKAGFVNDMAAMRSIVVMGPIRQ
ncbi:hypothetical protein D9M68_943220 [compost metagenome]